MSKRSVAVLQFEIDHKRWHGVVDKDIESQIGETQRERLLYIAHTAINDTIRNGGTFVLVAGPEKITMVQRTDAETFDEPAAAQGQTALTTGNKTNR
jgi:hypothetical protein